MRHTAKRDEVRPASAVSVAVTSRPHVAVIGAGTAEPRRDAVAEEVGRRLAEAGAVLVCGGRGGVMEASCRGAREAGGTTIGLLPGLDRREGNPHLSVAICTGMGHLRNAVVVSAADAVIAVGGEWGTLSEIGFAFRYGRPVIGLDTWELTPAAEMEEAVELVATPAEAVARALALAPS